MAHGWFDEHASEYDGWFLKNRNVLESEVLLLEKLLQMPGKALSVGCGSGLFEMLLREEHGIEIAFGIEPADGMARIAEKRGLEVERGSAEDLPYSDTEFDTVLFNGTPSYISNLERAFQEAQRVLKPGGRIVVADVPAESSYALLYRLAVEVGSWDHEFLLRTAPEDPYPVEFAAAANWRSTQEKSDMLKACGFQDLEYAQTLTRHPRFTNDSVELPVDGYRRGDYVAIRARRS